MSIAEVSYHIVGKDKFGELWHLYRAAFPGEDLIPLVSDLLEIPDRVLSISAQCANEICGHIMWTMCGLEGSEDRLALLGPLAVMPDRQGQGVGSGLVDDGIQRLKSLGIRQVIVLGDPAYYGRFGFKPDRTILPPYPMPDIWQNAWQSLQLDQVKPASGRLVLPKAWLVRSLWLP